jgi:hypothetical protein
MTSSDIHKKAMLEALEKSLGVVTLLARQLTSLVKRTTDGCVRMPNTKQQSKNYQT